MAELHAEPATEEPSRCDAGDGATDMQPTLEGGGCSVPTAVCDADPVTSAVAAVLSARSSDTGSGQTDSARTEVCRMSQLNRQQIQTATADTISKAQLLD